MDFDSNRTSIGDNWLAITHWLSQSVEETLAQFHKCTISSISVALACGVTKTTRLQSDIQVACSWCASLHTAGQTRCHCTPSSITREECPLNQSTPMPETQDQQKVNLPAHSQEHCTQKVCRPPFLQRLCNVTVEEKTRTLLTLHFTSKIKQRWLWLYPLSAQEALGV